jgi:hypothetical protein
MRAWRPQTAMMPAALSTSTCGGDVDATSQSWLVLHTSTRPRSPRRRVGERVDAPTRDRLAGLVEEAEAVGLEVAEHQPRAPLELDVADDRREAERLQVHALVADPQVQRVTATIVEQLLGPGLQPVAVAERQDVDAVIVARDHQEVRAVGHRRQAELPADRRRLQRRLLVPRRPRQVAARVLRASGRAVVEDLLRVAIDIAAPAAGQHAHAVAVMPVHDEAPRRAGAGLAKVAAADVGEEGLLVLRAAGPRRSSSPSPVDLRVCGQPIVEPAEQGSSQLLQLLDLRDLCRPSTMPHPTLHTVAPIRQCPSSTGGPGLRTGTLPASWHGSGAEDRTPIGHIPRLPATAGSENRPGERRPRPA